MNVPDLRVCGGCLAWAVGVAICRAGQGSKQASKRRGMTAGAWWQRRATRRHLCLSRPPTCQSRRQGGCKRSGWPGRGAEQARKEAS